jgi:hypothetical protein
VRNAITKDIPVIVSAGNGRDKNGGLAPGEDAGLNSPARVDEAIVVGATTIDDEFAFFSNFGINIDILAPGKDIIGAGNKSSNAEIIASGSSQSA